jgi:4a-hydroxytetrahydrobiopterin dehydratase
MVVMTGGSGYRWEEEEASSGKIIHDVPGFVASTELQNGSIVGNSLPSKTVTSEFRWSSRLVIFTIIAATVFIALLIRDTSITLRRGNNPKLPSTNSLPFEADSAVGYFSIDSEQCPELQSSRELFSFLLPCATYVSDTTMQKTCVTDRAILSIVPEWDLIPNSSTGDVIHRTFEFEDFQRTFLFMIEVAQLAEKNQHHPDWRNNYNKVDISLTTDDLKCLSFFDVAMARGLDHIYSLHRT